MYHYAGNNPIRYIDPDGREAAVIGGILFAGGIIALGGTLHYMTTDEFKDSCKGLGDAIQYGFDYASEEIKSWFSSDYSKAEDGKDKNVGVLQNSLFGGGKITSASPSPMPHGDDDEKQHDINRSIKDAKKISSNEDANDFAMEKGYKDAHELKRQYVGKENISKYNIFRNNKTGEAFLINRDGSSIIKILD